MLSRKREALRRLGVVRFRQGDRVRWTGSMRGLVGTIVKAPREDEHGEHVIVDFDNGSSYTMQLAELEHL